MTLEIPSPPAATQGYCFAHTMLRVKDLQRSLDFYCGALGMSVLRLDHYEKGQFSLCFLGYLQEGETLPQEHNALREFLAVRRGILELTHNWGKSPEFAYDTGNGEKGGYGHIAISVSDFSAAIEWLDKNHIPFKKRPEEGSMRDIAFVFDPDGYWVEIIKQKIA